MKSPGFSISRFIAAFLPEAASINQAGHMDFVISCRIALFSLTLRRNSPNGIFSEPLHINLRRETFNIGGMELQKREVVTPEFDPGVAMIICGFFM